MKRGIRKTDGPKKRGKKQMVKGRRAQIKKELARYFPERDVTDEEIQHFSELP